MENSSTKTDKNGHIEAEKNKRLSERIKNAVEKEVNGYSPERKKRLFFRFVIALIILIILQLSKGILPLYI